MVDFGHGCGTEATQEQVSEGNAAEMQERSQASAPESTRFRESARDSCGGVRGGESRKKLGHCIRLPNAGLGWGWSPSLVL